MNIIYDIINQIPSQQFTKSLFTHKSNIFISLYQTKCELYFFVSNISTKISL